MKLVLALFMLTNSAYADKPDLARLAETIAVEIVKESFAEGYYKVLRNLEYRRHDEVRVAGELDVVVVEENKVVVLVAEVKFTRRSEYIDIAADKADSQLERFKANCLGCDSCEILIDGKRTELHFPKYPNSMQTGFIIFHGESASRMRVVKSTFD